MNKKIIGYNIEKIVYRGKDIFTIYLKKGELQIGLNLLSCFSIEDKGVIGKSIENQSFSSLGAKQIFICQKYNLNPMSYKSLWIQAIDKKGKYYELIAACKYVEINQNIHLHNPISEDKY